MTRDGTKSNDSQRRLARSIARSVRRGLPAPDSEEVIAAAVREALLEEACRNELVLARLRVAALAIATMVSAVVYLAPFADAQSYPLQLPLIALLALVAAIFFLRAVDRGWYRPELRRATPVVDAVLIAGGAILFAESTRPGAEPIVTGFFGVVAALCGLLAFSGALRLSRHAAIRATLLALLAWVTVAASTGFRMVPAVLIGATILVTGLLGSRFTRMIRRVITTEVSRMRLARLYADAQAAIDAREEVLRVVAHDLRNPLGTIAMAADFLLEVPVTEEERARHLGIISRAGMRMNRLIHDLLDVARIEAGRLPIEQREVELGGLLDAVLEMMEPLAADRGLRLVSTVPPGLPPVLVDPDRIVQVLSNLIGNAIKFTPGGGRITIRTDPMEGKVRVVVADTGPGIPPEELPQIFGRMWQAKPTDTRGIGLGLSIAKAIVEAHGETIGVESRPGEGAEFWFTLPSLAGADAMHTAPPAHLPQTTSAVG